MAKKNDNESDEFCRDGVDEDNDDDGFGYQLMTDDDGPIFNKPKSQILSRSETATNIHIENVEKPLPTSSPDNLSSIDDDYINNKAKDSTFMDNGGKNPNVGPPINPTHSTALSINTRTRIQDLLATIHCSTTIANENLVVANITPSCDKCIQTSNKSSYANRPSWSNTPVSKDDNPWCEKTVKQQLLQLRICFMRM